MQLMLMLLHKSCSYCATSSFFVGSCIQLTNCAFLSLMVTTFHSSDSLVLSSSGLMVCMMLCTLNSSAKTKFVELAISVNPGKSSSFVKNDLFVVIIHCHVLTNFRVFGIKKAQLERFSTCLISSCVHAFAFVALSQSHATNHHIMLHIRHFDLASRFILSFL